MCASNEYDATTDRYLNQKSPTYPPNRPVYICISDIYIYIYIYVHIDICIICVCICVYICVCIYIDICIHNTNHNYQKGTTKPWPSTPSTACPSLDLQIVKKIRYPQKSPMYPQKGPVYPQKSPMYPQKRPVTGEHDVCVE